MTFRGEIHHGAVVLEAPLPLPEGTIVECTVVTIPPGASFGPELTLAQDERPVWERVAELSEALPESALAGLPADGASNLDSYLYNAPRNP